MTRFLTIGTGIGALGAAVLLSGPGGLPAANSPRSAVAEIQSVAFSYGEIFPWIVGSPPVGSAGAGSVAAAVDGAAAAAAGTLKSANTFGPLALTLNSIRAINADPGPAGSPRATTNYTNMDEWAGGIAGLMTSRGALGFADDTVRYDPFVASHAGVLQMANTFGPAFFDLNVLKAIGFHQAPSGTVLASGYPDNISAVDIGRWNAGIPGVITNSGTTGFVAYQDDAYGYRSDHWVGGLHTTTKIGSTTLDFNFLPYANVGVLPPSFSAGLAPDLSAAETPYAPITPPTPGVVQPNGGLPSPAPVVAAAPIDRPATTDPVEEPTVLIRGANAAPVVKTSKNGTASSGGSTAFDPLKTFTDAVKSGLDSFSGAKPSTGSDSESGSSAGSDDE